MSIDVSGDGVVGIVDIVHTGVMLTSHGDRSAVRYKY